MNIIIIKRYGINSLGANPEWVEKIKQLPKGSSIPLEWEVVTRSELTLLQNEQKPLMDVWRDNLQTEIVTLQESDYNDYKQARQALKELVEAKGFLNCTFLEKKKACDWFLTTPNNIFTFYTIDLGLSVADAINLKVSNGVIFNTKSYQSRLMRFNAALVYVRNIIERSEQDVIGVDLVTYGLENSFVKLGIEGTMKSNYEEVVDSLGILDYLYGTENWINAGRVPLSSRITVPLHGIPKQTVLDTLIAIVENGSY